MLEGILDVFLMLLHNNLIQNIYCVSGNVQKKQKLFFCRKHCNDKMLERFAQKWIPVLRNKTRQNNNLEHVTDSSSSQHALEYQRDCFFSQDILNFDLSAEGILFYKLSCFIVAEKHFPLPEDRSGLQV